MAIIWKKLHGNDLYEVRSAGASIRLYSNGVFHSQYNPKNKTSNSIWDLLILPVFFYPRVKVQRILILGVGGGAAIKLLHQYAAPEITGIELDPIHLKIAKRFFKVTKKEADLICHDAVEWLKNYSGAPFDIIIDDLFTHKKGEISRAVKLNNQWFRLLNRNVTENGLLVINTADRSDFKDSAYKTNTKVKQFFNCVFILTHPTCENKVYVFCKQKVALKNMKQRISKIPIAHARHSLMKLVLRVRKLAA